MATHHIHYTQAIDHNEHDEHNDKARTKLPSDLIPSPSPTSRRRESVSGKSPPLLMLGEGDLGGEVTPLSVH